MQDKHRLAGKDKQQKFLDAFRLKSFPGGEIFAAARPAGPCGAFPMNDTWVDEPAAPGVVLVGDAAGYSDPLIGEGLWVAMRDVRSVSEVLRNGDDWSPGAFAEYVQERAERMRRLRFCADIVTTLGAEFVPGSVERRRVADERLNTDPELFMLRAARIRRYRDRSGRPLLRRDEGTPLRPCVATRSPQLTGQRCDSTTSLPIASAGIGTARWKPWARRHWSRLRLAS